MRYVSRAKGRCEQEEKASAVMERGVPGRDERFLGTCSCWWVAAGWWVKIRAIWGVSRWRFWCRWRRRASMGCWLGGVVFSNSSFSSSTSRARSVEI